jgi:hypothetical protein
METALIIVMFIGLLITFAVECRQQFNLTPKAKAKK